MTIVAEKLRTFDALLDLLVEQLLCEFHESAKAQASAGVADSVLASRSRDLDTDAAPRLTEAEDGRTTVPPAQVITPEADGPV